MACRLQRSIRVTGTRKIGLLALGFGAIYVAASAKRRALLAQKLAESRRFVSRRIFDREARDGQSVDRWDDEGGAASAPIRT